MKKTLYGLMVMSLLLGPATYATAQVNIGVGIGFPNMNIGINLPMYPVLSPVPGYPVYYAPEVNGNYFFYDSMYWVYQDDNWYASSWYNGPWSAVEPMSVPLFILRIPVRYYQQPPHYFRGWHSNAPPRWGQHWGNGWEHNRRGWDKWNRKAAPARAPQPTYQRQYAGDRYPGIDQQHSLRNQSYRYQPRDRAVRQHIQQQTGHKAAPPPQRGRVTAPPANNQQQIAPQRPAPHQQGAPADRHSQPPQRGGEHSQRVAPGQPAPQQHGPAPHEQKKQAPRVQGQEEKQQERGRGNGHGPDKDDDRGRGR